MQDAQHADEAFGGAMRGREMRVGRYLSLAVAVALAPGLTAQAAPSTAATDAPHPPSPAASPANGAGTSALVVDEAGAQTALSLPVQTTKGENLGRVVDVVVDRGGGLLAAVVDFGGFLGVGSRKIAVDWRILHFPKTGGMNSLIVDMPLNQLREAPAYRPDEPIVIMGAPAAPTASRTAPTPSPSPPTP